MLNKVARIQYLVNYLNKHTDAYNNNNPSISDKEWDDSYFELQELEKETNFILCNSPTQTIIYDVMNSLNKVEHSHKMLSLEKTKDVEVLKTFIRNQSCLIMSKMDGLTCSLTYENGMLISAETRGNGIIGEDILHNAKVIPSIPQRIPYKNRIVVDGEIICSYEDFEIFAEDYKNPRNFASGSIRLLDSKECAKRKLSFVLWDIIEGFDEIECLSNKFEIVQSFGFEVVPYIITDKNTIEKDIEDIKEMSQLKSYPIDGAVIKYDNITYGKNMGETAHHFKNAIAYKFYDETYATRLIDIEWTMGRTGVLTPVAVFESIEIDGSIVERASLHNISIMEELFTTGPYIGQTVEVYKANAIIPQISSVDNVLISTPYPSINTPECCPICGAPTEVRMDINTKMLVCSNPACSGKLINKLDHFCGKKGLDIKGLSVATLEKLIEWGWVSNIIDIFNLRNFRNDWITKNGFGVKSVDKLLDTIDEHKNCDLDKFIAALGIPLIGSVAAKDLANQFKSWDEFISAVKNRYNFMSIDNFGEVMYDEIINFDYSEAEYLVNNIITFNNNITTINNSNLDGLKFVITGKVNRFKNRDELKSIIESYGGKVIGSISKNTDYLINNDVNSSSTKNLSAQKLNIPILSEDDFIQTFGISI